MDLKKFIADAWIANTQVIHLVTEEPYRAWQALSDTVKHLKLTRDEDVQPWCHDKVSGFNSGRPTTRPPADKTNSLLVALPMMMETRRQMQEAKCEPPFNPEQDIIFMLKDPNFDLNEGQSKPSVIQFLRNMIQSNMCSPAFCATEEEERPRGKRMVILVTAVEKLPEDLPEVDPIIVPLPDQAVLDEAIANVIDPLVGRKKRNSDEKLKPLTKEQRQIICSGLIGLTYQKAEESLAMSVVENGGYDDIDAFLASIEHRKSLVIAGVPGLQYISKDKIPFDHLPGYEELEQWVRERASLDPDFAREHNLEPLKGITIIGRPGGGKTEAVKVIAKILKRPLVIWSIGESQGGLVGQSEEQCRMAINIIKATNAVALIDDVDKAGLNAAAQGHTGDGGVMGRIVQMLLTEMSVGWGPFWCFTGNRVQNIPPELIRAGRMDERWYVQAPDATTRLNIFQLQMAYFKMTADSDSGLARLASDEVTNEWVGAEIRDLVREATIRAIAARSSILDTKWMLEKAKSVVPMAKQAIYAEDIKAMEDAARQFRPIGRVKAAGGDQPRPNRGKREVKV